MKNNRKKLLQIEKRLLKLSHRQSNSTNRRQYDRVKRSWGRCMIETFELEPPALLLEEKDGVSELMMDAVRAYYDKNNENGYDNLLKWFPFLKDIPIDYIQQNSYIPCLKYN